MNISESGSLVGQLLLVLYAAPITVVMWTLFKRSQKSGWFALIPFYNLYVMGEIAGKKNLGLVSALSLFALFLLLSSNLLVDYVVLYIALITILALYLALFMSFVKAYDKSNRKWLIVPFVPMIGLFFLKNTKNSNSSK